MTLQQINDDRTKYKIGSDIDTMDSKLPVRG